MRLFVLLALSTLGLSLLADDERVQAIDQELTQLNKELQQKRLDEMNTEVNTQLDMLDQWGRFTHQLEKAQQHEHEVEQIEKRIQDLKQRRAELSKEFHAS